MSRRTAIRQQIRPLEPPGGGAATLDHKAAKLARARRWNRATASANRREEQRWTDR